MRESCNYPKGYFFEVIDIGYARDAFRYGHLNSRVLHAILQDIRWGERQCHYPPILTSPGIRLQESEIFVRQIMDGIK